MARGHGFWYTVGQAVGEVAALSQTVRSNVDPESPTAKRGPAPAGDHPPAHRPAHNRARASTGSGGGGTAPLPPTHGPPLDETQDSLEWLLARTATSMVTDRADRWLWKRRPGLGSLLRAATAGAGAAVAATMLARLVEGEDPTRPGGAEADNLDEPGDLVAEGLAGAGRGLVYAGVLQPLLPGPPAFRGALYGVAEYVAGPWGGITLHLSAVAPQRRVPVLRQLLEPGRLRPGSAMECVTEGVLMGTLYGSPIPRSSRANGPEPSSHAPDS